MKYKKIPYYLLLALLTIGASIIVGFLSFGGMYLLWPSLVLAISSLVLSVAYEGEIYLQNIKGALNKLFYKRDYLKHHLAKEYLLTLLQDNPLDESMPPFFQDYINELTRLHAFSHHTLDKKDQDSKGKIEKNLRKMEKWFAIQLFSPSASPTPYQQSLQTWLKAHDQDRWQETFRQRQKWYLGIKLFSLMSSLFMGVGTSYLLIGPFEVIPFFATLSAASLPFLIIPMAILSGTAYGLLTYNAMTDMINHHTLNRKAKKIFADLSKGLTFRSVSMAITAGLLLILALSLTVCTAGTWWTVVKNTKPLFAWMTKIPNVVMGVIHPAITGFGLLVFNLQNISESLDMIDGMAQAESNVFSRIKHRVSHAWQHLRDNERVLQWINPFRILLKLTITPLRVLLFLGHLVSIGVMSDRMPKIPEILSTLLGIINEGFEDVHYFFDHHDHPHEQDDHDPKTMLQERLGSAHAGHDHSADIPTQLLKLIFSPVYALSALWDRMTRGNKEAHQEETHTNHQHPHHSPCLEDTVAASTDWPIEKAIYCTERFKEKQLAHARWNQPIAAEKIDALESFQASLRTTDKAIDIKSLIQKEAGNPIYQKHRFFSQGETKTSAFLAKLSSDYEVTCKL